MSTQDDELMFSIGVTENPNTRSKLEAMAKAVEEFQKRFSLGVESVGAAAMSVKGSVTSVTDQMKTFSTMAVGSIEAISASVSQLQSLASKETIQRINVVIDQPATQKVEVSGFDEIQAQSKVATEAIESLQTQAMQPTKLSFEMPSDLKSMFDEVGSQLEDFRAQATEDVEVDFGLPANLKNVFMEFSDVSIEAVDKIHNALDEKIVSLAKPMSVATTQIKLEYAKRVADHAKAYAQMADDMDRAVDRQTMALDRQQAAIKKSARGMIEGAKGFMQLGLLSRDSSDQIVKGLVAIEGAVNMLEGGIDVMQSFSQGWRAMRDATKATGKVGQIAQSMSALGKVGTAASIAGTGASLVGGAASIGGAATSVTAGGIGIGAGVAGVGAIAAPIAVAVAAAAAALAALSLVAVELSETFRGTATKQGSVTDTIASAQVGMVASVMRMTGMFERTDSIGTQLANSFSKSNDALLDQIPVIGKVVKGLNMFGDAANLAASYAAVERSQKLLAVNKIKNEQRDKIENADRDAGNEIAGNKFKSSVQSIRNSSDVGSLSTQQQTARFDAQSFNAQINETKKLDKAREDKNPVGEIESSLRLNQLQSSRSLNLATAPLNDKMGGEMQIQVESAKQLAIYQQQATDAANQQGRTSEKYKDSIAQVKSIQDQITDSYQKQKGLVAEKARAEIQGQAQVAEGLKRQLDMTMQGIESIKSGYKSSAINFAKLGYVEQEQALDAMSLAKTEGPEALDEHQRDLLRSVGGKRATDFADNADLMEAKGRGFDKGFGDDFTNEAIQMQAMQRNIEAQIQTNYTATVKVDFDSKAVERSVVDQVNKIMSERNNEITLAVQENLSNQKREINDETKFRLAQQKNAR